MFKPNRSLDAAIAEVMRHYQQGISERVIMRTRLALLSRAKRQELERQVTATAVAAAAIPPAQVVGGVFVGNWLQDLLQFLIDNWEVILEIVLAIIAIFLATE